MSAQLHVSMDIAVKREGTNILKKMGITPSQVITMLFKQVINTHELPFRPRLSSAPNQATIDAIEETRNGGGKTFKSAREMMSVDHGYTK